MGQEKPYDITLKDDTTKTGLMLVKDDEGKKLYNVSIAPTFVERMGIGAENYAQYQNERVWAQDNFSGGFGAYKAQPDRYFESHNVNCCYPRMVTLGPLVNVTAQSGGTALGQVSHWSCFVEHSDALYLMTDDGTDIVVWVWDTTNNYWTAYVTGKKRDCGGLCSFGIYLVSLMGGGYYRGISEITLGAQACITNDDNNEDAYGAEWEAQTFTLPATVEPLNRIKVKVYRTGSPGTITVSIRATTTDKPSGGDLRTGSFDGDTVTESTAGEWVTVSLNADWTGTASTKYAVLMYQTGGDASNKIHWRCDATSPAYTTGARCYSANSGVAWTEDTAKDFMFSIYATAGSCAVIKDTIWRANPPNDIYSCTDVTAAANWTSMGDIGDAQSDITSLMNLCNILLVGKEDGLYSFDNVDVTNLIPDYRCVKNSHNFHIMQSFHNEGYMAVGDSGLIHYDSGSITDLSPKKFAPKVTDIGHRVEAITRSENLLYVCLYPKTQSGYYYILAGEWQGNNFAWHPIARVDTENAADIGLRSMLVTTVEGNPWLWVGESGSTKWKPGYFILPAGHLTPNEDSTCTFAASGDLITSYWDGELIDVPKAFDFIEVKASGISSTETIRVYYEVDDETTWTEVGGIGEGVINNSSLSGATAGEVQIPFQDGVTGKRIRLKFSFARGGTTTNTPVLESFALHSTLRPKGKRRFRFVVHCEDSTPLLTYNSYDTQKADEIKDNLWRYIEATAPVTMQDIDYDGENASTSEHKVQLKKDECGEIFIRREEGRSAERVFQITAIKSD